VLRRDAKNTIWGRWWLLSSPSHDESCVNPKLLVACPSTKGVPESELINLLVGLMQIRISN
jgi:hypothetical protein